MYLCSSQSIHRDIKCSQFCIQVTLYNDNPWLKQHRSRLPRAFVYKQRLSVELCSIHTCTQSYSYKIVCV